jgi:hypothetical protein
MVASTSEINDNIGVEAEIDMALTPYSTLCSCFFHIHWNVEREANMFFSSTYNRMCMRSKLQACHPQGEGRIVMIPLRPPLLLLLHYDKPSGCHIAAIWAWTWMSKIADPGVQGLQLIIQTRQKDSV